MSTGVAAVVAAILGSIVGSFLNVVAYRLPRKESLLHPGSRCPECETPIKPYDNVPVLGWLWLRGRCRACGAKISWRYPAVEAVAAIVLTALFQSDSLVENLIAGAAAGGFFLVAAIVYPAGMGMGDVKLAGVMGLVLGRAVVPAIFAALLCGTIVGMAIIA